MTPEKAIELLKMDIDNPGSVDIQDVNQAEQLGIEALKQFSKCRKEPCWIAEFLLPGETKE